MSWSISCSTRRPFCYVHHIRVTAVFVWRGHIQQLWGPLESHPAVRSTSCSHLCSSFLSLGFSLCRPTLGPCLNESTFPVKLGWIWGWLWPRQVTARPISGSHTRTSQPSLGSDGVPQSQAYPHRWKTSILIPNSFLNCFYCFLPGGECDGRHNEV